MSYFQTKMHQIRFWLDAVPDPAEVLTALSLSWIWCTLFKNVR